MLIVSKTFHLEKQGPSDHRSDTVEYNMAESDKIREWDIERGNHEEAAEKNKIYKFQGRLFLYFLNSSDV